MEFSLSPRCQEFRTQLTQFMDDHVYPAESVYEEQLATGGDPHGHPPIIEELKASICAVRSRSASWLWCGRSAPGRCGRPERIGGAVG
ncbi:MAG TPA: hypothetical protein VG795_01745, partial [Acidimicrobiia bacterium]|nr:hypothetical protein [Acidimicrobiia bacterium]